LSEIIKSLVVSDEVPLATHVARVWRAVVRAISERATQLVTPTDFQGADLVLGSFGQLPLDPYGFLNEDTTSTFIEFDYGVAVASLRGYGAVIMALGRWFHTFGLEWRVFYPSSEIANWSLR